MSNEQPNETGVSLNTLKWQRFLIACCVVLFAVLTLLTISYNAFSLLTQSAVFSGNWRYGVALILLTPTIFIFTVFSFGFFVVFKDTEFIILTSRVGDFIGRLFVYVMKFSFVSLCATFLLLPSVGEMENPPIIPSLLAIFFFFTTLTLVGITNELDYRIAKKIDPNYERAFGFT